MKRELFVEGEESRIYFLPDGRVLKELKRRHELDERYVLTRAKEEYYKHAIASTLFPENFLRYSLAVDAQSLKRGQLYSKRVKPSPEYEAYVKNYYGAEASGLGQDHKKRMLGQQFKGFATKFVLAGIMPNTHLANVDFPTGEPRKPFFFEIDGIDPHLLRNYLEYGSHPKAKQVLRYLARLEALQKEREKEEEKK